MLGPGQDLFDFMADCLLNFMIEHDLLGQHYRLGFTFSFPTDQRALAKADLSTW
jgi:hexokinase